MDYTEYISEIPTKTIIAELENRYPAGFIMAFLTDDPSFNNSGFTEYFKSHGPSSVQRGLAETLVDYIISANEPGGFGGFDFDDFFDDEEEDEEDDEDQESWEDEEE